MAGDGLDRLFRLTVAGCAALTLLVLQPGVDGHAVLPTVDLALDTISLVAFVALATLAWARFRETHVIIAAYHAAAFQAMAVAYGIAVLISLQHSGSIGSLEQPENVQVLVFAVAGLAAAILFVIAGAFTSRRSYGWNPTWILVAPTLAVLVAALVGAWLNPPPDPLQIISITDTSGLPTVTPFGALVHILTAVLFFVGAYVSRAAWRHHHAVIDGWIAIGLVLAGFSELNWVLYPSAHPGQVSIGDLFRLAFSLALLIGLEAAVRSGLRELRVANAELAELRDKEGERAALEERSRLSRELHDGLAQELWLAKLKAGRLKAMPSLGAEATALAGELVTAIDTGLADARQAVSALRTGDAGDHAALCDLMRRHVDDFGDRFGLRTEYDCDQQVPRLSPRAEAEVLRIAQEALNNVQRHADATLVRVRLESHEGNLLLTVSDNGRGFDPAAVDEQGVGLSSMRERTALMHGQFGVVSRPQDGTSVILEVPVTAGAPAGQAAR